MKKFNFFKSTPVSVIFLLILLVSISYSNISPEIKSNTKDHLDLQFSGKLTLDLPFSSDMMSFRGEINLLNIKLKGNFFVKISKRDPLVATITSKYIQGDINQIVSILKKVGIKISIPKDMKGDILLQGCKLKINNNNYYVSINKISGPIILGDKILTTDLYIDLNLKDKRYESRIKDIIIGHTYLEKIYFKYNQDGINVACDNLHLDMEKIQNAIFKFIPKFKNYLIKKIEKNNKYIPHIDNIYAKGMLGLKKLDLFLSRKDNNIKLQSCAFDGFSQGMSVLFKTEKKIPMKFFFSTNSIAIAWNQNKFKVVSNDININFGNIYIKNHLALFKKDIFYIPSIKFNTTFSSTGYYGNNSTKLNLNVKIFPKQEFVLKVDKNSNIISNLSLVEVEFKDNQLIVSTKNIDTKIKNFPIFLSKEHFFNIVKSRIHLKNNSFKFILKDNKYNLASNCSLEATDLAYKGNKIKLSKFSVDFSLEKDVVNLFNGILDGKLNQKGSFYGDFKSTIPVKSPNLVKNIYKNSIFRLYLKKINLNKTQVEFFNIEKNSDLNTELDYNINFDLLKLRGKTSLELQDDKINIITRKLYLIDKNIKNTDRETSRTDVDKTIAIKLPEIIEDFSKDYHFEFDTISYQKGSREYLISSLKGDFNLEPHPMVGFNGYFCNIFFSGELEYKNPGISGSMDFQSVSLPFDQLAGCFISSAPLYITGNTNLQLTVNFQGHSVKDIKNSFSFDGFIDLEGGRILKLSNLGQKVKWILEVLSYVKLNPSRLEDSLEFNRAIASFSGGINKIEIKQIKLISPMLNLYTSGELRLDKNKIELRGIVKKGFISKQFHLIDKISNKKD